MTEERNPLEVALDLFVFAPVGMLLSLTEDLPKLVERGRGHLESQLGMARMMGEMAAPQLQTEATKLFRGLLDRVTPPGAPPGAPTRTASTTPPAPAPAAPAGDFPVSPRPAPPPGSPSPGSLAIPGYDSLSAMHVVQRLAGLSQRELEAVRRYEQSHRRRKTIINRAEQLLAEAD